ncbi:MAG: hypothetical protein KF830_07740 [Planctomycetes bacterium]|nr:hypothetical protein [Planctomycetota bacterium]
MTDRPERLRLPAWALAWRRWPRRRRLAAGAAALLLGGLWWTAGGDAARATWPRQQILDAIRFVESGDRDDVPDGDGGLAIGPYQIHRVYWQDAIEFEPGLGGDYPDCRRRDYAERVLDAYMRRWAPAAWRLGDAETIARIHNGGPRGAANDATQRYWQKVRERLP